MLTFGTKLGSLMGMAAVVGVLTVSTPEPAYCEACDPYKPGCGCTLTFGETCGPKLDHQCVCVSAT